MHPLIIHSTYTLYIEKFNYIKFKPKQNPKPERFYEKVQNTQEQRPTYACILRKKSKINLKRNLIKTTFQSRSSSERSTYQKNSKWPVEADQKKITIRHERTGLQHQLINTQTEKNNTRPPSCPVFPVFVKMPCVSPLFW